MQISPGTILSDRLRMVRLIGEGGMGSVWLADDLAFETQVAVKFMSDALVDRDDALARFAREARCTARIKSPHVVQMLDYRAPADEPPYMVMEVLEGESLSTRLASRGPLTLEQTAQVVSQVCRVLERAHALGIVHRDIKDENIFLIDGHGEIFVKVLDFGVAKNTKIPSMRVTSTGTTLGTPHYMSPEQMLSTRDVDARCDLWSLAVVAYLCLTRQQPFVGTTFAAVCLEVNRGLERLPSETRPELAGAVDAWFQKALTRDINQRFTTATEMRESFERVLKSDSGQASTPGPAAVVERRSHNSDMTAAVSVAGAAPSVARSQWRQSGIRMVAAASIVAAGLAAGVGIERRVTLRQPFPHDESVPDDLSSLDAECPADSPQLVSMDTLSPAAATSAVRPKAAAASSLRSRGQACVSRAVAAPEQVQNSSH